MVRLQKATQASLLGLAVVFLGNVTLSSAAGKPAAELADLDLAQLIQIEIPTVVAASKHEQKVTEAPANVTIVTGKDVQVFGYRTLSDLLRSVPGFYVTYDRSYGFIGVRGFNRPGDYGGRILLLVNGHRVNDPIYASAPPATDFILDVDLIERVEIIRGPGSSLYGDNAFFAVINVITRRAGAFNGPELAASAGSLETYRGRASFGQVFSNGVEVVVSGSVQDSRGEERLAVPEFGQVARRLDDDQFASVFASASYRGVTLEGAYSDRQKQVPNALYGTVFGDPRYQYRDQRAYAELRGEFTLGDGTELLARGHYDYYSFDGVYPYDYADPGDPPFLVLNEDRQAAHSVGTELRVRRVLAERHTVTVGLEARSDFDVRLRNYDVAPPTVYQDSAGSSYWLAAYAQDEYRLLDNLLINAGLRLDYYDGFGETLNPRVAVIWEPVSGTTLKALGGTAFRAPNAYEREYVTNITSANPDLDPEKIRSAELIWEQALGNHLRSSVAGFYNQITDLISQTMDTLGNDIYKNLDGAKAYGAEAQLQAQWASGWRGHLSYTFTETEDDSTGRHLDNSPRHLAKLALVAPLYRDKIFAGVEVQYTSSRQAPSGDQLNDFVVANLTLLAHRFAGGWEAAASLYNVFDTRYSDPTDDEPAVVRQDGRQWRVKLTYRF